MENSIENAFISSQSTESLSSDERGENHEVIIVVIRDHMGLMLLHLSVCLSRLFFGFAMDNRKKMPPFFGGLWGEKKKVKLPARPPRDALPAILFGNDENRKMNRNREIEKSQRPTIHRFPSPPFSFWQKKVERNSRDQNRLQKQMTKPITLPSVLPCMLLHRCHG